MAEPISPKVVRKPRKKRECISGLEWYPKLKLWKAENINLDPKNMEAWSYGWWVMLKQIGPHLVFNDYRYSVTTSKHQAKLRFWLKWFGFEIEFVDCPDGLQDLYSGISYYNHEITKLESAIAKPRSQKKKNAERRIEISKLKEQILFIEELMTYENQG